MPCSLVKLTLGSNDGFVKIPIKEEVEGDKEELLEDERLESNDKNSSQNPPSTYEQSQMLLLRIRARMTSFLLQHYKLLRNLFLLAVFVAYMVYYGFAMAYSISSATALTVFTSLGILIIILNWIIDHHGPQINRVAIRPSKHLLQRHWHWLSWLLGTTLLAASMLYIFLFTITTLRQVRSLFGAIVFLVFTYLTSKRPDKVRWGFVGLGLFAQLVIGVIVLRTSTGFKAVNFIFREIIRFFLYYPMAGSAAVYGDPLFLLHPIAMFVTSLLVWLGCVTMLLYHITRVIRLVRYAKRWLPHSTDSQLHLLLVSTHATISGLALSFLSVFGESPHHMATGVAMCFPAAIAFSLLSFPEDQKSTFSFKAQVIKDARPRPPVNLFLKGYEGSLIGGKLIGLIIPNILAATSLYALFDSVYSWLAGRVGIETNITGTLGYAFMPIVYLMGVRWEECYVVGCIIADKVFGLVLRALRDLGYMISLNKLQNDTAVIATHAILGVSLLGTLSAWMGVFQAIAPRHRHRMMAIFPRIIYNVNIVCFFSASVAVVLSPESEYENPGSATPDRVLSLWNFESRPSFRDLM